MDTVVRTLHQNWWLVLLQGALSVVLGVLALAMPGVTLGALILLWGLFALLNGVVEVFSAIGAATGHRSWGWQLAGGLVGILAGLAILRWPGLSALFVLYLVATWAIMMGIVRIVGAIADHDALPHAWLVALHGVVSMLFGIAMFAWPGVGLLTLVYLVGIYAIVYGVIACVLAFRLHSLPERMAATLMPPPERRAPIRRGSRAPRRASTQWAAADTSPAHSPLVVSRARRVLPYTSAGTDCSCRGRGEP